MPKDRQPLAGLYVPLDAEYAADPKILRVGPMGELLFVRSLAFAKRQMEDGYIDAAHLDSLALKLPKPAALVAALVRERLWSEVEGGWVITSWSKWNPSRAAIEEKRRKKQEAAAKGNHARWHGVGNWDDECDYCIAERSQLRGSSDTGAIAGGERSESTETETETEGSSPPDTHPSSSTHALPRDSVDARRFAMVLTKEAIDEDRVDHPPAYFHSVYADVLDRDDWDPVEPGHWSSLYRCPLCMDEKRLWSNKLNAVLDCLCVPVHANGRKR